MVLNKLTLEEKTMLEEAYREYGVDIIKLTMKMLKDRALAEDCAHNVVIKLMGLYQSRGENCEQVSKLYILKMAVNDARNMISKRSFEVPMGTTIVDDIASVSDTENKAGVIMRDRYGFSGSVSNALGALDDLDKSIIFLTYKMGYNAAETAAILGITTSNVAKRISRAKVKMRKVLEKEGKYD